MNADERGQIEAVLGGTERAAVVRADVLTGLAAIPDGAVDCIVTSPPYWGLRRYAGVEGGEWPAVTYQPMSGIPPFTVPAERSCYGLEATIEAYVAHTVLIGRELRRVLADHGTLWWNLGDSFCNTGKWGGGHDTDRNRGANDGGHRRDDIGLKPLDLCLIPQRVELAFQADGWFMRSEVVWAKPSCMPQSIRGWQWTRCRVKVKPGEYGEQVRPKSGANREGDLAEDRGRAVWQPCPGCEKCRDNDGWRLSRGSWRPTTAHESIFRLDKSGEPLMLLAKTPDYFADGEAVREEANGGVQRSPAGWDTAAGAHGTVHRTGREEVVAYSELGGGRNPRTVWTIGPEPNSEAVCADCGETYNKASMKQLQVVRVDGAKKRRCECGSTNLIGHYAAFPSELPRRCILASTAEAGCCSKCGKPWAPRVESRPMRIERSGRADAIGEHGRTCSSGTVVDPGTSRVLDYRPTCSCNAEARPAVVLDPFAGSGTTILEALRLGRRALGIELSEDYHRIATNRVTGLLVQRGQAEAVPALQRPLF